jgi:LmbE family N-acetylglucosaminyl deacetylase
MAAQVYKPIFTFRKGLSVLALGPHADDIEIGCGATLLYLRRHLGANVHYVVFCDHFAKPAFLNRKKEIRRSAKMLGCGSFDCWTFADTTFPNDWRLIQERIAALRELHKPDLIFAPRLDDNHQDHVVVAEAARREFRHGEVLWHYEIKQYGQDQFEPNILMDVSGASSSYNIEDGACTEQKDVTYRSFLKRNRYKDTFAHRKVYILRTCMKSQLNKPFLHPELLLGTMRFRGMQSSPNVEYAEAFQGRVLL